MSRPSISAELLGRLAEAAIEAAPDDHEPHPASLPAEEQLRLVLDQRDDLLKANREWQEWADSLDDGTQIEATARQ